MSHPLPDAAPDRKNTLLIALLAIGAFSLFVVIVLIAYRPPTNLNPANAVDESEKWKTTTEGRQARLAELKAKEQRELTTYGWLDQAGGVVRLPVDRAVELSIAELQAAQARR